MTCDVGSIRDQPRSIQRGNAAAKKDAVRNRNYARKDALIGVYDSLIYITVYFYEYEIIIVQLREGSRPHGNK